MTSAPTTRRRTPSCSTCWRDEFRSHGYDLKFLIRAITATKAYGLTSAVGRSELAPANLFAAMPVRTLSPGQLFETLAQATGFREGSGAGYLATRDPRRIGSSSFSPTAMRSRPKARPRSSRRSR